MAAFLAYWMGYSGLGMRREIFLKYLLISFYPLLLFGLVEIVGVLFVPP